MQSSDQQEHNPRAADALERFANVAARADANVWAEAGAARRRERAVVIGGDGRRRAGGGERVGGREAAAGGAEGVGKRRGGAENGEAARVDACLLYTSPSPRDRG